MTTAVPAPLIDPAALRAALDDPRGAPVVLDVRWHLRPPPRGRRRGGPADPSGLADFDAGHVPGAVFVDLDTELAGPPGPAGRHPLPDPDDLQDTLRRVGVDHDATVVVYDAGDGLAAARAWWVLRWAGLRPDRVLVLDGGWPAWEAAGLPASTESGGVRPMGDVAVGGGAMPVLTADAAAALAAADGGILLDARAPARFAGEEEPMEPVAGHVPGARNLPAGTLLDAGRWRPPAELAEALAAAGSADRAGAYCGSGVSAAMIVLAAEIAGVRPADDPVALYVGSWSHWCGGRRPVETGPGR